MVSNAIQTYRNDRRLFSSVWAAVAVLAAVATSGVGCGRGQVDAGAGGLEGQPAEPGPDPAGAGGGPGAPGCEAPALVPGVWSELPAPAGQAGFNVTDAFAAGPDDLFFAGVIQNPDGTVAEARVLRWRQGCWTVELTFPGTAAANFFLNASVHGTGPNDVWAVGGDSIYHRNSSGWSLFRDDSWRDLLVVDQPPLLQRIRTGSGELWVAEFRHILHFDGYEWTAFNFDSPDFPDESGSIAFIFNDIWIDGPDDVSVVGGTSQVGNTMDPAFLHHWDGSSWTRVRAGVFGADAIWRAGANLWITVPGNIATINGELQQTTLRRYDGTMPEAEAVGIRGVVFGDEPISVTSLWGHNDTDLWAAGDDVVHYDGVEWAPVAGVPDAARSDDIGGTHVTGDAGAVWLSTPGPRFFRMPHAP